MQLAQAGEDVSFIMRSAYEPTREHGLDVMSNGVLQHLEHPQVFCSPEDCGPVELVLVCLKSTNNAILATALPPLLHSKSVVMTMQNGMGNDAAIAEIVDPERIFIALCFICCMMESPGKIGHTGGNDVQIAPSKLSEQSMAMAESLSAMFNHANIRCRAFEQAEQILWHKLGWNIPFNGLCLALGGISIKKLFTMPEQVQRARSIMEEVYLCSQMRGYPMPDDIVEKQFERTSKMGEFIPSSAVDYNKGRPVEYPAIWGICLEKAHEINCPVPVWEQLAADIRERLAQS